ncbi:hypothetical protein [Flavobacterium noncentrifugens]|uniref:Uncharacterized protein n=1 Tax=Flavobacterium noncentrifugens TaxID=1128970 RepID=A0A1G8WGA0_9FLAO|nr:hypothetical protein [Flavobacterium noncentrifugens]SDJ77107.1 hypothetical protein SAMN04487935_1801 [Flavobacterium noncentrifugens]
MEETTAMETNDTTTLKVKICGSIESPPENSREQFKQSVIDTVLHILLTQDVSIEYIGYNPGLAGLPLEDDQTTAYEDCVYVSLNVRGKHLNPMEEESKEDIIKTFVEVFENKTHRHLEIDSTLVGKGKKQRIIEMSSNWKLYLNHG